eukprot:scaffold445_cov198-Prasinococcus_capsulatus_cf.AAC.1
MPTYCPSGPLRAGPGRGVRDLILFLKLEYELFAPGRHNVYSRIAYGRGPLRDDLRTALRLAPTRKGGPAPRQMGEGRGLLEAVFGFALVGADRLRAPGPTSWWRGGDGERGRGSRRSCHGARARVAQVLSRGRVSLRVVGALPGLGARG